SAIYDEQRSRYPNPNDEQRDWLRNLRGALIEEYPGYTDIPGIGSKAKRDTAIRQLEDAVGDPTLAETDAGQGLALYLAARTKAAEQGRTPTSFRSAKSLRGTRDWLRTISTLIQEQHPGFTPIW